MCVCVCACVYVCVGVCAREIARVVCHCVCECVCACTCMLAFHIGKAHRRRWTHCCRAAIAQMQYKSQLLASQVQKKNLKIVLSLANSASLIYFE